MSTNTSGIPLKQIADGFSPDFRKHFLGTHFFNPAEGGDVLLSPVWHRWREGGFDVITSSDSVKARHLRRDPRASIVVYEHVPPYRGLELRCRPRFVTDGVRETVETIAIRYLGAEEGRRYVDVETDDTLLRLEPGVLRCWDFADDWPAAVEPVLNCARTWGPGGTIDFAAPPPPVPGVRMRVVPDV